MPVPILRRRSTVAALALVVVLVFEALADPVGLLAVIGWSGARWWPVVGF